MNELRNSKSDDQLEELLLLTEQMQEELDQKDRAGGRGKGGRRASRGKKIPTRTGKRDCRTGKYFVE